MSSAARKLEPEPESLYDVDFAAWCAEQARLLLAGAAGIDAAHLAEEIADIGKRERRELRSRLQVLLMHQPR